MPALTSQNTSPKNGGFSSAKADWTAWMIIASIILISLVATLLFQDSSPGDLNNTGKHGMFLFKRYMAEKKYYMESYSEKEMSAPSEVTVHLVPLNKNPLAIEANLAVEERIEGLKKRQSTQKNQLIYLIDFSYRNSTDTYQKAIYQTDDLVTTANGYILQNKVFPFERKLVDLLIQDIKEKTADILDKETSSTDSQFRMVYHSDLLSVKVDQSHWMDELPNWLRWGLLQLLLVLGFYFIARGRQFGFPLKDQDEGEPTPLTYVSASAAYYRRHQLSEQLLEWYYQALRSMLPKDRLYVEDALKDMPKEYAALRQIEKLRENHWRSSQGKTIKGKQLFYQIKQIDALTHTLKEKRTQRWKQYKQQ